MQVAVPDTDEIVVYMRFQAVPRYVVHFERCVPTPPLKAAPRLPIVCYGNGRCGPCVDTKAGTLWDTRAQNLHWERSAQLEAAPASGACGAPGLVTGSESRREAGSAALCLPAGTSIGSVLPTRRSASVAARAVSRSTRTA